MMAPLPIEIRKQNIDTMNAISVEVEISDKLKKAKLENGFYNLIDGERVSAVRHCLSSILLPEINWPWFQT